MKALDPGGLSELMVVDFGGVLETLQVSFGDLGFRQSGVLGCLGDSGSTNEDGGSSGLSSYLPWVTS